MINFSYLFQDYHQPKEWVATKNNLKHNIDAVLEKGSLDKDVLLLMKDLLDDIKICTSIVDYGEEANDGN